MAKKILSDGEKQKTTQEKAMKQKAREQKSLRQKSPQQRTSTATMAVKKQILQRDQVCQFKDLKTGKQCGATHFLEIDHITPKYLGGKNNIENLRVLCKNHNQYRFQKDLFS